MRTGSTADYLCGNGKPSYVSERDRQEGPLGRAAGDGHHDASSQRAQASDIAYKGDCEEQATA